MQKFGEWVKEELPHIYKPGAGRVASVHTRPSQEPPKPKLRCQTNQDREREGDANLCQSPFLELRGGVPLKCLGGVPDN